MPILVLVSKVMQQVQATPLHATHVPLQGEGFGGAGDNAAAREFEEELQRGGLGDYGRGGGRGGANASQMLLNVLGSTGGVRAEGPAGGPGPPTPSPAQRAAAVRELCVSALGPVLFEVRVVLMAVHAHQGAPFWYVCMSIIIRQLFASTC